MPCDEELEIVEYATGATGERNMKLSRATMVEAISHKLTSFFTTIVGNAELALLSVEQGATISGNLEAIKKAALTAQSWNAKLIALMAECRAEQGGA
jgi:hypothetical protein